jgi:MoxR-like ATPase
VRLTPNETGDRARAVITEVTKVIVGKDAAVEQVLLGVLAGGHVLLEDLPGLGKTVLARTFAAALGLSFARVQFTPDLLPQDITGASVYDPIHQNFEFRNGPVFTQVLLADEINRTPPKTQAALLEAMGEQQVTADGITHKLPSPFVVLATQNPIEFEGTYALPEAQLDRFSMRVSMGYLDSAGEKEMVNRRLARGHEAATTAQIAGTEEVLAMRESLEQVDVHEDVLDYIVAIVTATRRNVKLSVGASPRGTLALVQLSRGYALLRGRDYVVPEDVQAVAVSALGHRLVVKPELWVRQVGGADVVAEVLAEVPVPAVRPAVRPVA